MQLFSCIYKLFDHSLNHEHTPGRRSDRKEIELNAPRARVWRALTNHRPYAIEEGVDYSQETPTLVEFRLEDTTRGTRLRVTESGFSKVPEARRALAFRKNDEGWRIQLEDIAQHVAQNL